MSQLVGTTMQRGIAQLAAFKIQRRIIRCTQCLFFKKMHQCLVRRISDTGGIESVNKLFLLGCRKHRQVTDTLTRTRSNSTQQLLIMTKKTFDRRCGKKIAAVYYLNIYTIFPLPQIKCKIETG